MKRTIIVFLLSIITISAQEKNVKYELYVKCCMGEVSPNESTLLYEIYKDGEYMGLADNGVVQLPDTGVYVFSSLYLARPDTFIRHFEKYGIYCDTIEVFLQVVESWEWNEKSGKSRWYCDGCVMDGHIIKRSKTGFKEWEGLYKEGKQIWYKEYDKDEILIYYTKRSFWGKEKVILDNKRAYRDKMYEERKAKEKEKQ